jgi:hypothetical protein
MTGSVTRTKVESQGFSSSDARRLPRFGRGPCGGLAVISAILSDLKQSVRVDIRWLHGPPIQSKELRAFHGVRRDASILLSTDRMLEILSVDAQSHS